MQYERALGIFSAFVKFFCRRSKLQTGPAPAHTKRLIKPINGLDCNLKTTITSRKKASTFNVVTEETMDRRALKWSKIAGTLNQKDVKFCVYVHQTQWYFLDSLQNFKALW